ncbi:hypothetical protein BDP27DRAFT_1428211 [Rhodocollybia butyracea]|uniref:Uncharacterized protein n=1 Tax=Rhodocollybia butyracea TaxID=206335 RepID=A0A9P5PF55_9AGAR|nr:hypothetical protein BDP27DRAFT_1428211 [Rhodocollybia butyracea]
MSSNFSSSLHRKDFAPYTPSPASGSGLYPSYTLPSASPTASSTGSDPYTPSPPPIIQHERSRIDSPAALTETPSFDSTPIVRPLFIDNLAMEHKLTETQRKKLHIMAKFASVEDGVRKPELLVKLYEMSLHFELYNNPKAVEDQNSTDTLRGMLRDLQIRLQQTFTLTPNQNKTSRAIVQDLIYDPLRTCYQDLGADIFDHIKKNAKQFGFDNVFGVPAYEKVLEKSITRQSSSVRNGLCQHLRDGMGQGVGVLEFTGRMNCIYLRAGGPAHNRELILNRNILLRHFIHRNPNAVWMDEEPEPENEEDFAQPSTGTKKRKLKATVGRVPKGQDFGVWSINVGKSAFIDECCCLDEAGFDSSALHQVPMGNTEPPLPGAGVPLTQGIASTSRPADERMQSLLDCA